MRVPATPLTLLGLVVVLAQPAQLTPTRAAATQTVPWHALITAACTGAGFAHYGAKMGFGMAVDCKIRIPLLACRHDVRVDLRQGFRGQLPLRRPEHKRPNTLRLGCADAGRIVEGGAPKPESPFSQLFRCHHESEYPGSRADRSRNFLPASGRRQPELGATNFKGLYLARGSEAFLFTPPNQDLCAAALRVCRCPAN